MFAKRLIARIIFTSFIVASLLFSNLGITPVHAASIIVNTANDDVDITENGNGFCSLREAILNANNNNNFYEDCSAGGVGIDTITFAGNYTITLDGAALPLILSEIIINGNEANNTIIQAYFTPNVVSYRVFSVSSSGNLTLNNLTVKNGRCGCVGSSDFNGGGIYIDGGILTVTNSKILQNNAAANGGGIYNNNGTLIITNSTISGNSATSNGGGIMINDASTTISDSTFSGNTAAYGGGIYNEDDMSITSSNFSGNSATSDGGGIYHAYGILTVTNSTLSGNNNAGNNGGGIYKDNGTLNVTDTTISGNSAASGAGIYNSAGSGSVEDSSISGNNATSGTYGGGAIYNNGDLNVLDSTLSGNNATTNGGGVYNATSHNLGIYNSTVSGNDAGTGGGVFNNGNLWLGNATISGNEAYDYGGGIYSDGGAWIHNSTIAFNTLVEGTNSGAAGVDGNVALYNTLVVGNLRLISSESLDCSGTMYTEGYNLFGNFDPSDCSLVVNSGSNAYLNDLNLLGPLQNNGGPTWTHALLPGSNAIDTGNNTLCANWPINNLDGRGLTRSQGSQCDVGAYEKMAGTFPTFADVPTNAFAWAHIESIFEAGITGGCSNIPKNYCPSGTVTRAQMAVFLMKGIHGSAYSPPPATGAVFNDVPVNSFAAAYIEAFANEGITGGCGSGNYCPNGLVTRAQMAVFLLKAKYDSSYTPPAATGTMFNDVPSNAFAAAWIEQLATEGITGGCGGGNFCPNVSVTRAQMAVFLQKTFDLPMP